MDSYNFFNELFKNAKGWIELRYISGEGGIPIRNSVNVDNLGKIDKLTPIYNGRRHCYFSLCPRKTSEGKFIEDVSGISVLWVDLDAHDGKTTKEEILQKIDAMEIKASIVVDSGAGYHVYFLLNDFYPIQDNESRIAIASILEGIRQFFGGDKTSDLARIFRIPGTINIKPDVGQEAKIIRWNPERRYPISTFSGFAVAVNNYYNCSPQNKEDIYQYPLPEIRRALRDCDFYIWCRERAEHLPEPIWYAMITGLIRYEGGEEAIHDISSEDPRYKPSETQRKIIHALNVGHPHTCDYLMGLGYGFECNKLDLCKAKTPARFSQKGNMPIVRFKNYSSK